MTTTARNASVNSNQFEFVQLIGQQNPVTKTKTDIKILQLHPGQAICRCKVSRNGLVDGPEHKEWTVLRDVLQLHVAYCIPTFQEISRLKSCSDCTEMCKKSVLHVQSRQPIVALLIKPLLFY